LTVAHLRDVMGNDVAVYNRVARLHEPIGVPPWATTDVGNDRGRRGKCSRDHFDRAGKLDTALVQGEPATFLVLRVVGLDRRITLGDLVVCRLRPRPATLGLEAPEDRDEGQEQPARDNDPKRALAAE
jgi:hypothetical protein